MLRLTICFSVPDLHDDLVQIVGGYYFKKPSFIQEFFIIERILKQEVFIKGVKEKRYEWVSMSGGIHLWDLPPIPSVEEMLTDNRQSVRTLGLHLYKKSRKRE